MQRRAFLHTGIAAGLLGVAGRPLRAWTAAPAATRRRPLASIKLSSNENPLGIAPAARQAIIDGLADANRYPSGREELAAAIATKHGVRPEEVVLGAGSTEVLKMAVDALAAPDGHLVVASPTYEDTTWYAGAARVHVTAVPLLADGAHDLEAMRAAVRRRSGPSLVFICNPNNPTGTLTPSADVDAWIQEAPASVTFLVDEAYLDYVESERYHSAQRWIADRPNVIVSRTFSKVYGMAGLRLGYGLAHRDTAARLRRTNVRNNVNHVAMVAGLASLGAEEFTARSLAVNRESKRMTCRALDELDLHYYPTHTNFIMHQIRGDVHGYIDRMREAGIRVGRPFPPMMDHNRVSLGLPEEMARFIETLREFRNRGWV